MISGIKLGTNKISFGATHARKCADPKCIKTEKQDTFEKTAKPERPTREELEAANYPMTYYKNGELWHRNLAAEYGTSDDFDCDREGDPDYVINPADYYLPHDVYEFLHNQTEEN